MNFHTEEELLKEIDSVEVNNKPLAFSNRRYPLELLNSREFEILIYYIFKKEIETGIHSNKHDAIRLMKGVGERGRDAILLYQGKNVGVVQCKRYINSITKPDLGREVIKFLLHSIQDKTLISDKKDFCYYFTVSNSFNEKAIDLINNFNVNILSCPIETWVNEVLEENENILFKTYDEVKRELLELLSSINLIPITGVDIDGKLKLFKELLPIFFEVEKVASESMLENMFQKFLDFRDDEDLDRLRQRLKDLPKDKRMSLGLYSIYGYPESFYKKIAKDRTIIESLASFKGEVNKRFIDYLLDSIERYQMAYISGIRKVSPFTKQAVVPYLFNKFSKAFLQSEMGKVMTDKAEKRSYVGFVRETSMDAIKKRLLKVGDDVLKNDFSKWAGDEEMLEDKKQVAFWIHNGFTSVDEMSERFDEDMKILSPIIQQMETKIAELIPIKPTIIIQNSDFLDDKEEVKRIMNEANRLDKK